MEDLSGMHVDAVSKLLQKLDRLVATHGTHVTGKATFVVYDEAAVEAFVTVRWDGDKGFHYLVG